MAKIIFITRGLHDGGGIERVLSVIASGLSERHHEIAIVALEKSDTRCFPLNDNVEVLYPEDLPGLGAVRKLKNLYATREPDLVIAVGTNRSYLNVAAAEGYPLLSWEHFNCSIKSHPFHNMSRQLAAKKGGIITLTNEDADLYRKRFKAKEVYTLYNPVTLPSVKKRNANNKIVLAVGRLKTQKGFDRLLRSWAQVVRVYPDWLLRIVGSGPKEASLKKQAERAGIAEYVEFIPYTDDIAAYYEDAEIFALSSRYEGFALVMLEAMSAGLPVVSYDIPFGLHELLQESGAGLLVESKSYSAYAYALMKLIANDVLREEMAVKAEEKSKDFTLPVILDAWEKMIEEVTHLSEHKD